MTFESSLLYIKEDRNKDFVHDTYRSFFLAKELINNNQKPELNNRNLDVAIIFYCGLVEDSTDIINDLVPISLNLASKCYMESKIKNKNIERLIVSQATKNLADDPYNFEKRLESIDSIKLVFPVPFGPRYNIERGYPQTLELRRKEIIIRSISGGFLQINPCSCVKINFLNPSSFHPSSFFKNLENWISLSLGNFFATGLDSPTMKISLVLCNFKLLVISKELWSLIVVPYKL